MASGRPRIVYAQGGAGGKGSSNGTGEAQSRGAAWDHK